MMKAILLFIAIMLSIASIRPQSEEVSFAEVCTDSSGCPVQASSKEAIDDNLIEEMSGLLDSVGGDTFEGDEASHSVTNETVDTEQGGNVTWWEKLESQWGHLFPFEWDQMAEWMNEVRMEMSDWFQSRGIQLPHYTSPGDDKTTILLVVASTLLLLHFINLWIVKSGREKALIARLAEMDRKLFVAKNEALIAKRDGDVVKLSQFDELVKEKDTEIVEARLALEQALADCEQIKDEYGQTVKAWKEKCQELTGQVEESKKEKLEAVENCKQSEEMMEEMLQYKDRNKDGQKELLEIVEKLQAQLKGQNILLGKYEPMLKEKEKRIRELVKESKQLKIDEANARLELDKVRKELNESRAKVDAVSRTETDWKSLTDLLQSQINEKMATEDNLLTEVGNLKSKLAIFKSNAEVKEEQLEELKELVLVLESKKEDRIVESDGWDLGEECVLEDAKEVAKLRVHVKKLEESMTKMKREMNETQTKWDNIEKELQNLREENELNLTSKEEAVKEREDTVRKLDVLTEFFNKKETELQKQLGIQCAKFDHISTDAETANKKLVASMTELDATQATLKIIKRELEEQEVSLKASVASEEKKAHENWVAARQAERKLADLQGDLGLLRNRITTIETENYALVKRNEELQKINNQSPAVSVNETSIMNGAQNGYTIEAAPNGLAPNESLSNGMDYVKMKSESTNEYTNFNGGTSLPSEPLFSEVNAENQSIPSQPSLPPLPGLNSFTSPPSHLPGLASLPGLSETAVSLPSLLPSLPGVMTLANTTIPTINSHFSYQDSVTDGRPPSYRDTPKGRRKNSPEYDRVSSSTSHYRSYSPPWRASSRMSYEGDSPPRSGRHGSNRSGHDSPNRTRHGSPNRSRHGSPNRSRHGFPDRSHDGSPNGSHDVRHSRGDRRTYPRQSPTRSHHERDRGMSSREGSSDRYQRRESGRKKSITGSNDKSLSGTGWGKGYQNPDGYKEGSQKDRDEEYKAIGRTFPDETYSKDHTDQFRNLI